MFASWVMTRELCFKPRGRRGRVGPTNPHGLDPAQGGLGLGTPLPMGRPGWAHGPGGLARPQRLFFLAFGDWGVLLQFLEIPQWLLWA